MIFFYWFLLAILLATYAAALRHAKRNSHGLTPLLGWMVGLGFFLILPLAVLTFNGGYKQPAVYDVNGTWDEVNLASVIFLRPYLFIWLSTMLTCFVAWLPASSRLPGVANREGAGTGDLQTYVPVRRRLERAILITMALAALDWVAMIWLQGGVGQFLASNWYTRNGDSAAGRVFVLYTRLSLTNQMIFTGAAALYASIGLKQRNTLKHRNTRWGFTSLILLFFLIEIVMSGNRIFFALYLLAFLTSCWLYRRTRILAGLLVASPVLVLAFSLWGSIRANLGTIPESAAVQAFEVDVGNRTVTHLMGVSEGSGVMLLMHMINDFGTKFDYLYGGTYARLFTFFLPGSRGTGQLPDFSTLAAELYEPGQATSLGATALGEAYANFGAAGMLVMPLLACLAVACGNRMARADGSHSLMAAVSFVMFVAFVRFPFAENALTWIAALALIWALKLEKGLELPAERFRPLPGSGLAGSELPADG
jgi:oligosaccharide repeat unit polymerase